jgi:uncharacterized membrane protein YesL
MNSWEGKTASFLRTITNILILNFLWVISSMPILTIGPSTAAMTGVIRKWHLFEDYSVFRSFICEYRLFIKQGSLIGTVWIFFGFLLVLDVYYFLQIQSSAKVVFIGITLVGIILYIMTSALLFPILVHYETKGLALIKQAFIFSFLDGKTTFAIILMWIAAGMVVFYAPYTIFVILVPVSMISFRFAMISFGKLEKFQKIQSKYIL